MTIKYLLLRDEISEELDKLEKLVSKTTKAKTDHQASELYTEFAAMSLQSYYTGLEKIFRVIAAKIDGSTPRAKAGTRTCWIK